MFKAYLAIIVITIVLSIQFIECDKDTEDSIVRSLSKPNKILIKIDKKDLANVNNLREKFGLQLNLFNTLSNYLNENPDLEKKFIKMILVNYSYINDILDIFLPK